jgi:hypothetical protein
MTEKNILNVLIYKLQFLPCQIGLAYSLLAGLDYLVRYARFQSATTRIINPAQDRELRDIIWEN